MALDVRLWAALVIAVFVAAACSSEVSDSLAPPADDVVVRVTIAGEVAVDWTLADLDASVEHSEIVVDGDTERGPRLLEVLTASGVEEWESAEVIGMGEGRSFAVSLEVSSSQVNEGWILDVTRQGTLKLAAEDLPREQWVRDVAEIRVR